MRKKKILFLLLTISIISLSVFSKNINNLEAKSYENIVKTFSINTSK